MSGKKERITVSLDPGVAAELKGAAERAGAASVSEYVEGALDARMVREQWLARWRAAAGEVDPDALAYARRALTGDRVEQRPRVS
jgi:metal-responsive CopG/Arc/MetJ family transcriptional regulator